ncbi:PREDICTED: serine/threonine-protein phosphatase 7 long form homolog [Erythranthe guttata]|uniref:serine/threonine-protein phosphatase 7 long form homolog n=1 Tax=Erythranthe guttata TaxID=4155 RepID=UPI00064DA34E|nr:PREDICTED: serine/threonine-protein phosphatase 7 long form homolog [Erythranthe guttata]|eukprot:XP_012844868.1 PREDICTED: serine/threonine-protein phosphatase 7 long form homolog [Erythranthe guttata]
MTITLHEVAFIMGLRVDGPLVAEVSQSLEYSQSLASLLGLGVMTTTVMFRNKGINWTKVQELLSKPSATDEKKMQGYLMFLLGSVLFVDKTFSMMKPWWIHYTNDIDGVGQYSWAAACLANMYRQLGIATRVGMNGLCGCQILLLCWIFEYFPCFFNQRFPRHIQSSSLGAESGSLAVVVGRNCSIIGSSSTKCQKEMFTGHHASKLSLFA